MNASRISAADWRTRKPSFVMVVESVLACPVNQAMLSSSSPVKAFSRLGLLQLVAFVSDGAQGKGKTGKETYYGQDNSTETVEPVYHTANTDSRFLGFGGDAFYLLAMLF